MLIEVTKNEETGKYEVETNAVSSGADLESNKTATIDVSAYTEPVEITPTAGKDGMRKATVTLNNIPSGGSVTLYGWSGNFSNRSKTVYTTSANPQTGDKALVPMEGSGVYCILNTISSVPDNTHIMIGDVNCTRDTYSVIAF